MEPARRLDEEAPEDPEDDPARASENEAAENPRDEFTVTPVLGTFAVVVGLALFPIAALLLCIGILALVHAIF